MMQEAYLRGKPRDVEPGYVHLPYITDTERGTYKEEFLKYASVARCASVSYLRQGENTWSIEVASDKGMEHANNRHWSPFEHVGICAESEYLSPRCGNYVQGWYQWRKFFPEENTSAFRPNHPGLIGSGYDSQIIH
jgi:hypothetical protein